ncbi:MAG: THUMP domain-containing protein, partial [Coriobacteriia bacterium]|nr:THUMP domain-containing protein [Coriobacteriia bacterium]
MRPLQSGVAFFGTLEQGLRACLWLRTASRVLLILDRVAARDGDQLYQNLSRIPWEQHIAASGTFAIDAYGINENLRNSQFLAMRAKDAIVDRIRSTCGVRPTVQKQRPDVLLNLRLRGDKATIAIDLSGEPLHRRGYRLQSSRIKAPLKESLAAAMLLAA